MTESIKKKVKFVEGMSNSITPFITGITKVEYVVFKHNEHGHYQEFVVITYNGGARTVRNCNGNSYSAILDEINRYINSGYYSELEFFHDFEIDPTWTRLN